MQKTKGKNLTMRFLRLYFFMVRGAVWLMQPIPYFGEKIRGGWIYEPKIDGWRMQILRYNNGEVECWGRRLERRPNWSQKLPQLVTLAKRAIPKGTLIDCELYSSRGRRFIPSLFARKPKARPIIYVFDIIYFEDKDVSQLSLRDRKQILAAFNFKRPFHFVAGKKLMNIKEDYTKEVKQGYEGIVIKDIESPYLIGKEAPIATQYWRKIK